MRGACSTRNYKILVRKPEKKRPLVQTKRGLENNIKTYVKGTRFKSLNTITTEAAGAVLWTR
jgi:hypothetical protein